MGLETGPRAMLVDPLLRPADEDTTSGMPHVPTRQPRITVLGCWYFLLAISSPFFTT